MHSERCRTCGQPLTEGWDLDLLDEGGHEHQYWSADSLVERKPVNYRPWLLGGAGLLALIATVGLLRGGDSGTPEDQAAVTIPVVTEAEPETTEQSRAVVPDFVSRDETIARLGALETGLHLSYPSGDRVVTIDLDTGETWDARQVGELNGMLRNFALLNVDGRTIGIDSSNPGRVFMVTTLARLVPNGRPDEYSLMTTELGKEAAGIVLDSADTVPHISYYRIPESSQLLEVPGLGVMITPPTGGTYLVTVGGFDQVSEGQVIAATPGARVEVFCDEELDCSTSLVQADSGQTLALPARIGSSPRLSLSPDNRWILAAAREGSVLHDSITRTGTEVAIAFQGAPQWAPDSSFVSWMQVDNGRPTLVVLPVGATQPIVIPLDPLDVADMSGDAFVLFTRRES